MRTFEVFLLDEDGCVGPTLYQPINSRAVLALVQ